MYESCVINTLITTSVYVSSLTSHGTGLKLLTFTQAKKHQYVQYHLQYSAHRVHTQCICIAFNVERSRN